MTGTPKPSAAAAHDVLQVGQEAPDFTLPSTKGRPVTLAEHRGKPVVLYFYPEDHTVGCTMEARTFRAYFESLAFHEVVILGVSRDNVDNHCSFQEKESLPFDLLSDVDETVHDAYGAWRETTFRRRRVVRRCTYIIGPDGMIAKTYPSVNVLNHAATVLRDIERIGHDQGWFGPH